MACFTTGRDEVARILKNRKDRADALKTGVDQSRDDAINSLADIAAAQVKAFIESIVGSLEDVFDVDNLLRESRDAFDLPNDIVEARYEAIRRTVLTELSVSGPDHGPAAVRRSTLSDIAEAERVLEELAGILLSIRALAATPTFVPPTNNLLQGIQESQEHARDRLEVSHTRMTRGQPTAKGRGLLRGTVSGSPTSLDVEGGHLPATSSRIDTSADVVDASDRQPINTTITDLGSTLSSNAGNLLICLAIKELVSSTPKAEHAEVVLNRIINSINLLLTIDPVSIASGVVSAHIRASAGVLSGAIGSLENAANAMDSFLNTNILQLQTTLQQSVKSIGDPTQGLQVAESLGALCNIKIDNFCKAVDLSRLVALLGMELGFNVRNFFSADVVGKLASIRTSIDLEAVGFAATITSELAKITAQLNKIRVSLCRFLHGRAQDMTRELNIALVSVTALTALLVVIRLILEAQELAENAKIEVAKAQLRLAGLDQAADALDCGELVAFSSMDLSDASSDARVAKQLRSMAENELDTRRQEEILSFAGEFEARAATSRLISKIRISSEDALEFRANQQRTQATLDLERFENLSSRLDAVEANRELRAVED